jgi:multiple sugar transport system permease protein
MRRESPIARLVRGLLLTLVGLFFLFPIFWVFLMSFQTNQEILRMPPSLFFTPTLENYVALISGKLDTASGTLEIAFMGNLLNSFILAACSVILSLILAIPAAYAFARYKFRLGEDIAFTILSFRFAPPLLVLVPLLWYFQLLGLYNTYFGLIWVYQLITLPLILWITRGYFEDVSEDIEHAHRIDGHGWLKTFLKVAVPLALPGIAAAALLAFIFARYADSPANAVLGDGLRVEVRGPGAERLVTDMPSGIGGLGEEPSPGWLLRAATASCVATTIAMQAAREGVSLTSLEVVVDAESDDRGILGLDETVPAGPLSTRIRVSARADDREDHLRDLIERGTGRCPVYDATKRAVEVSLEIEI